MYPKQWRTGQGRYLVVAAWSNVVLGLYHVTEGPESNFHEEIELRISKLPRADFRSQPTSRYKGRV